MYTHIRTPTLPATPSHPHIHTDKALLPPVSAFLTVRHFFGPTTTTASWIWNTYVHGFTIYLHQRLKSGIFAYMYTLLHYRRHMITRLLPASSDPTLIIVWFPCRNSQFRLETVRQSTQTVKPRKWTKPSRSWSPVFLSPLALLTAAGEDVGDHRLWEVSVRVFVASATHWPPVVRSVVGWCNHCLLLRVGIRSRLHEMPAGGLQYMNVAMRV